MAKVFESRVHVLPASVGTESAVAPDLPRLLMCWGGHAGEVGDFIKHELCSPKAELSGSVFW